MFVNVQGHHLALLGAAWTSVFTARHRAGLDRSLRRGCLLDPRGSGGFVLICVLVGSGSQDTLVCMRMVSLLGGGDTASLGGMFF